MLIGVLGAGQLGQMLGLAGINLGARFRFFDPATNCPAEAVGECIHADWNDYEALERFCKGLDVCTFEFENVPATTLEFCASRVPTYPNVKSLTTGQDRAKEKEIFKAIGFDVPPYALVDTEVDLVRAIEAVNVPCVLKARRGGYDGKGQAVIRRKEDASTAWQSMNRCPAILETFIPFQRELSVIGCRGIGPVITYPLTENTHGDGILKISIAPAQVSNELSAFAIERVSLLLEKLDHRGILAIEMFEGRTPQGLKLIPNEFAPRVHNTGHWTIEGANASQFENHIRAVMGLPLRSPDLRGSSAMLNLIGDLPDLHAISQIPSACIHLYGKEPRPGRKLGHVTIVGNSPEEVADHLREVHKIVES